MAKPADGTPPPPDAKPRALCANLKMQSMMRNFGIFFFVAFSVLGCSANKKASQDTYTESISKPVNGLATKRHYRKGWLFIDQLNQKKIVSREVYLNNELMYRFPIKKRELIKSNITLLSGKAYLSRFGFDTLKFVNPELPVMNRHVYSVGGTIAAISDSLFIIKPSTSNSPKVTFYVSVSANMDELRNTEQFISDSLVLPVR